MRRLLSAVLLLGIVTGCVQEGEPAADRSPSPGAEARDTASPSGTPTSTGTPTADPTGNATPAEVIEVSIEDGEVSPAPSRVRVASGERVRIRVSSDSADHVHVHGYDLEKRVEPGDPARFSFTADVSGLFEVETHHSGLVLFQLVVR